MAPPVIQCNTREKEKEWKRIAHIMFYNLNCLFMKAFFGVIFDFCFKKVSFFLFGFLLLRVLFVEKKIGNSVCGVDMMFDLNSRGSG